MTLAQPALRDVDEEVSCHGTPWCSNDEYMSAVASSPCSVDSCSTVSMHDERNIAGLGVNEGDKEDAMSIAQHYFRRSSAARVTTTPSITVSGGVYVTVRCHLGVDGTTMTTASVLLEGVPQRGTTESHCGLSLLIDQRLLRACLEDTPLAELMPCMAFIDEHVMPLVAREHAELTLYYDRIVENVTDVGRNARDAAACVHFAFRSFDLTSFSEHVRLRGVPLQPRRRYHFAAPTVHTWAPGWCGAELALVDVSLGSQCAVQVFIGVADKAALRHPPPSSSEPAWRVTRRPSRRARRGEGALPAGSAKLSMRRLEVQDTCATPRSAAHDQLRPADGAVVVFTTGMTLSRRTRSLCRKIGLCVNPDLECAARATVLVAEAPLIRSVKLLTVLPFVEAVVEARWLHDVLRTEDVSLPCAPYAYHEARRIGSIEHANDFVLADTLQRPASARRTLLQRHRFWVHPAAQPQEPPMNDLKSVLRASGGVVQTWVVPGETTALVMPRRRCSASEWVVVRKALDCSQATITQPTSMTVLRDEYKVLFVTPDDCFRCVLQQRDLVCSTVYLGADAHTTTGDVKLACTKV